MTIPIQNIYFLLCYAWDRLEESKLVDAAVLGSTTMVELFARVLLSGTKHLLKRGLDRGYLSRSEPYSGVRGKLDVAGTIRSNLLLQARTLSTHDDLSRDVAHNRILRATLGQLVASKSLPTILAEDLAEVYRRLDGIADIRLTPHSFREVQLHRNTQFYGFLLDICRLLMEQSMIEPGSGKVRFRDFTQNDKQLAALFQRFVYNFLKREQSAYTVTSPQIAWKDVVASERDRRVLPRMQTDIVLTSPERVVIIDTKFYRTPLQIYHGKQSVQSENLYQIYSYVRNATFGASAEGLLLYAQAGEPFCLDYEFGEHKVRVASLSLDSPWPRVHEDLLRLVSPVQGATACAS